jgi:flavodoxin
MTILVTYLSVTGNTKLVAKSIYDEIEERKEMMPLDEVDSLDGYDLTFIGFPIHAGSAPPEVEEFLERNCTEQNVAFFCTHASFADPSAPSSEEQIRAMVDNIRRAAGEAMLLGAFDCQGELAEDAALKFLHSPDPGMQRYAKVRHLTMGFPSANDLSEAKLFAHDMMAKSEVVLNKRRRSSEMLA